MPNRLEKGSRHLLLAASLGDHIEVVAADDGSLEQARIDAYARSRRLDEPDDAATGR